MSIIDYNEFSNSITRNNISVLPDFFLDIIVNPRMSYSDLINEIDVVYKRGGGNLLGPTIEFIPGGNGGNLARVLASLGVPTNFIANTSPFGRSLIEFFLCSVGVQTFITTAGMTAASLIFEIPRGEHEKNNVMLSSSGSVVDFSSSKLNELQWEVLKKSTAIGITNAQNLLMEELVETILYSVPSSVTISIDFSDLNPHINRIDDFRNRLLTHPKKLPTIIVGNENEMVMLAKNRHKDPDKAVQGLSKDFPDIIFGLHESKKSQIWKDGDQLAYEACYRINVLRATGAGDAWHAGFLTAFQGGLNFQESTKFANAVAALHISQKDSVNLTKVLSIMNDCTQYSL